VLAVAVVALLVASLRDHERCAHARSTIFSAALGRGGDERAALRDLRATCRGATALVDVAGALHARRRDREALVLAREAARREPRSAAAWRAVAQTAQAPAEARAAERRRRTLDPLG
jgi:3-hydroxy-3-methylglutaryl CoA synthase